MVINYCGNSCFKIQSGKLSIVTDALPRFKGDIVLLIRAPEESEKTQWPPEANQILGPGEYEIQGVEVDGWSAKNGTTNYVATVEEMRLGFLGETGDALEPGVLEKVGNVDILFVPAATSAKVIKQIQPKIVIPSYKKPEQLKGFLKEMEQKTETQEKLVIKKKELAPGTKVVALKA